ncbi:MAG: ribonuclease H-like domain-containing protein, partial [Thermoanaerobaculia bacterium]
SKRPVSVPADTRRPDRPTEPELPTNPKNTVLFDLETQLSAADVGGWQNAHRMLVAIGVVCHLEEGRLEVFREDEVEELVHRLEAADLVVGFNVKRFDYKVLSGYTGVDYRRTLPTMDLLEVVHRQLGFRLGLNHLAQATLEVEKSADGLQSLEWVKQGRLDLVEDYCRRDVEILRDLYLFGRRMGYVLYRDKQEHKVKLPIEW